MTARDELNKVLKKFTKYVTTQAKANLTRGDKNVKKGLYNSIKGEPFVGKNSIGIYFEMLEYGPYQDSGVKGKSSGNSLSTFKEGGFRFGTGTGKVKGALSKGINEWVRNRGFQFRDKKTGKFMSYENTAFLITRSIWQKGIKPSRFFSKPFEVAFKKLPDEVIEAYALDLEKLIKQSLKV